MTIDYTAKTAVVTGAASGIGRALSIELSGRGADLAISDVDIDGVRETARRCTEVSPRRARVEAYDLDVADRLAVLHHADEVARTFGKVNLVVNNAGVAVAATLQETSFEDLDWLLGVNLSGVINGSKAFLPHLVASGDGHLVNMSSVFGMIAPAYNGAYATSKFAVRGFTEALRQEVIISRQPVGVHCVHPGGVRTNIARNARMGQSASSVVGDRDPVRLFEKVARTSPEAAARTILAGVDRDRPRILVGPDAYLIAFGGAALGSHYIGLLARAIRRSRPPL